MARSQAQQDSVRKAAKASGQARKTSAKPAPTPRACGCHCGEMTKGGEFSIGHDAKYKSALVKAALQRGGGAPLTVEQAEAELARRNWTRFLEKSRTVAVRVPSEHKAAKHQKATENAAEATDRILGMKAAAAKVKEAGRNGTQPGDRITVTRENYLAILAASVKALKSWPANEAEIKHAPGKGEGVVEEMVG
jgi:hypothetical protein